MREKFNEEVELETKYNKVPKGMRRTQIAQCAGCDYRIYWMQWRAAQEEARRKGGSPRTYMAGFYIQPIPSCERRERCLVDNLYIPRGAKAPSSLKENLIKSSKPKENERRGDMTTWKS